MAVCHDARLGYPNPLVFALTPLKFGLRQKLKGISWRVNISAQTAFGAP
jgi:hypothetical protein